MVMVIISGKKHCVREKNKYMKNSKIVITTYTEMQTYSHQNILLVMKRMW